MPINTTKEERRANIEYSDKLYLEELELQPETLGKVAIVGGGPSLKDTAGLLDEYNGKIVALNGTHDYLLSLGIKPDYMAVLDARAENAKFVEKSKPDIEYWICAHCHPKVFNKLKNKRRKIKRWHIFSEEYDQPNAYVVKGASTVGISAISLMALQGYREFDLFGFDSCYERDSHHAYNQPLNDGETIHRLEVGGEDYLASEWMIDQAEEAIEFLSAQSDKLSVRIHGRSLIAAYINHLNEGSNE